MARPWGLDIWAASVLPGGWRIAQQLTAGFEWEGPLNPTQLVEYKPYTNGGGGGS